MDSITALNVQELRSQFRLQRQQVKIYLNLLCPLEGNCYVFYLKLFNMDDTYCHLVWICIESCER